MKWKYVDHQFGQEALHLIELSNAIIVEYAAQGFDLTLRQLYYQLVARDHIPNQQQSYKRLGSIINDARLAGLVDWDAIVDRTRFVRERSHWSSPQSIIQSAEQSYHIDMWQSQMYRPEVWIEKDALAGIISGVCDELDVPYFACRGYVSQSEMYSAGMRIASYLTGEKRYVPIIFHLGDHDPSGIDMTRDTIDRLALLSTARHIKHFRVDRLALNWDQIEKYDPPPNPTKLTDSRSGGYVDEYGMDSWELDALEPSVIVNLIRSNVETLIDKAQWAKDESRKQQAKTELGLLHNNYEEVIEFLNDLGAAT